MQNTLRFAWISQDENSITIRDIMGQQQTVVTPGYKRQDGTNQPVDWLNWSADGTSLVLGTNESGLHIWNVLQKQDICVFPNPLLYLSWSPDRQRILSWDTDGIMDVWNAHTGSTLARYTKHHDEHPPVTGNTLISVNIQVAEWSPNGRWIASQGTGYQDGRPQDNIVHIWDANTGGELCTYSGHQDQGLSTLVWSPDSTMIASVGKDGLVHVWDARNGTRLFLHSDQNKGLTWAPSGARVASAGVLNDSSNVVFEVWDATTGKNVVSYTDPKIFDQADQIIWSPDGQHIVTVTYQEVQVWTGGR
jgi:WD40 repeat protein